MLNPTTLRPGFLVSVKTSLKGNVSYRTTELGCSTTLDGAELSQWETTKTVYDKAEQERGLKARSLARSAIQTVCSHSAFGLLCPEDRADKLTAAVAKAREIADTFNGGASITHLSVNVLVGRVSPDDVEAVKAINSEIRDLVDTMAAGLSRLDVQAVRDAANKAKSVGKMLEPNAQTRVQKAIDLARQAARDIVKAGETGAAEIDTTVLARLQEARTSFLDIDLPEVDAPAPEPQVAEVDFEPYVDVPPEDRFIDPNGEAARAFRAEQAEIDLEDEPESFDPTTYDGPLDGLSNDKLNAVIQARGLGRRG